MDSGNSGSMQSSGGDDDYDPRAAADSSFINPIFNPLSPPVQPPTMFDPSNNLSNFFNPPISSRPQTQHNQINYPFFTPQSQTLPFPPHHFTTAPPRTETAGVSTRPNDQDQTTQVSRNPKKRSRASRRAPTTVLTTDTTNFRAMVQEFTGIPAPPFAQLPRSRLDLFSTPTYRSNFKICQTPSSYNTLLLRPLPQKLQAPLFSSNFLDDANNNTILSSQSPIVFPNSSELGLLKYQQLQPRGMNQMQNPNQSNFLQSSSYNSSIFGSKTEHDFSLGMPSQSNLKNIGALEDFGLSYGQVSNAQVTGLPDLISPENCNNFLQNVTNGKQNNYPATVHLRDGKRTTDNVSISATKGTSEGMMEPWIYSSD